MVAQVQECVFEKMTLLCAQHDFLTRLQLAQEAARVSTSRRRGLGGAVTTGEAPSVATRTPQERTAWCHCLLMDVLYLNPWLSSLSLDAPQVEDVYSLVHQTMTQAHVKDYVPFSWTTMVHVKSEHFKALSHYFAAIALCDCPGKCYSSEAAACLSKCWLHMVACCLGENAKKGEGTHAQCRWIQNLKILGCSGLLILLLDSAIHAQGRFPLYFWFAKSFQEGEQKGAVAMSPVVAFGTGWVKRGSAAC